MDIDNLNKISEGLGVIIAALVTVLLSIGSQQYIEKFRERKKFIVEQLSEFYDPIFTLLSVNADIFERLGPYSRKTDNHYANTEHRRVWTNLVEEVIEPNNKRICDIIETKIHLMSDTDDINHYMRFITHVYAYRQYRVQPFEGYKENFAFPKNFQEQVYAQRMNLRRKVTSGLLNFKG